jgi:hypothetical protein
VVDVVVDSQDHPATTTAAAAATAATAAATGASVHNRSGNGRVSRHVVQPKQVVHWQHTCVDRGVEAPVDGLSRRKEAAGV